MVPMEFSHILRVCLQGGGVFVNSGTVTFSHCAITVNYAAVRAHFQNFPSPGGKIADELDSRLRNCERSGQLQRVRAAESLKSSHRSMGDSHFARCLQGGGVYVAGGRVAITSCTISGHTVGLVRAHAQNIPSPDGENG